MRNRKKNRKVKTKTYIIAEADRTADVGRSNEAMRLSVTFPRANRGALYTKIAAPIRKTKCRRVSFAAAEIQNLACLWPEEERGGF